MIHVGVSSIAKDITLEKQAHRKGYQRLDCFEKCPANHICKADGAIRIQTKLNVDKLCSIFNENSPDGLKAVVSLDAGRYG